MTQVVGEVKQYVLGKCPKYKVQPSLWSGLVWSGLVWSVHRTAYFTGKLSPGMDWIGYITEWDYR